LEYLEETSGVSLCLSWHPVITSHWFFSLYRHLLAEERRYPDWKIGMEASTKMLLSTIAAKGMEYEEFMFSA
jgi:hypothetical protein